MTKELKYKCLMCDGAFSYEPIEGFPELKPTICEDCDQLREYEFEQKALRAAHKRKEDEISMLPYPDWDDRRGNIKLRNEIGKAVFADKDYTNRSLWVWGESGVGKTTSISCVARILIERGGKVMWTDSFDLLRGYASSFNNQSSDFYVDNLATTTKTLIIDDIGVGKVTERGAELFYHITNRRMIKNLPTWYTSNISPSNLGKWLGSSLDLYSVRIGRRIKDTCKIIKGEKYESC